MLASLFLISACGQKGPLYLKNEPAPAAIATEAEKATDESKTESKIESTDAEVNPEKKQ